MHQHPIVMSLLQHGARVLIFADPMQRIFRNWNQQGDRLHRPASEPGREAALARHRRFAAQIAGAAAG